MLAALAVLLNKRLEAKTIRKKNSFEQDNISWAGIRKYQICVHDCFLVKKKRGHILGIMDTLGAHDDYGSPRWLCIFTNEVNVIFFRKMNEVYN